jgi:hypothetical protein
MTDELKPCPLCNGEAKFEYGGEWQYYDTGTIECKECGLILHVNTDMRKSGASVEADAVAKWNTRTVHAGTERVERLRQRAEQALNDPGAFAGVPRDPESPCQWMRRAVRQALAEDPAP